MRHSVSFVLAALLALSAAPALAQTDGLPETSTAPRAAPTTAPSGEDGSTPTSDFIGAGWENESDWRFTLGPMRTPERTALRLTRRVPGGGIGVDCRRSGEVSMAMLVDGHAGKPGEVISVVLRVGDMEGPLPVTISPAVGTERDTPMTVNNVRAVTDVLYAIARVPPSSILSFTLPSGEIFNTATPENPEIADVVAKACDAWSGGSVPPR